MSALRSSARLRGKGQSDDAKAAASAPAAAVSSRRATRKRDADDEPLHASESATLAAAAISAASSVPDSKRPRRSSRTRSSTSSAADHKQEEEEEEEEEGQNKGGTDDAAARDEVQHGASDEEDADAAMAEATDSLLDSLRVATVGHLFSAATISGRPALPLLAVVGACDFLGAADIVLRLAPIARASYATAVEYAQMVVNNAATSEGGPSAASSLAAAVSPVGHRSGMTIFMSVLTLNMLLSSRLRAVVSGLMDQCDSPVDVRVISRIAEAIPSLRELWCNVASATVQPAFEFPRGLRHLHAMLVFKGPSQSSRRKTHRFSKTPKPWTDNQRAAFVAWVMSKAASLPQLTRLTLHAMVLSLTPTKGPKPKLSWLQPLFSGHTHEQLEDLGGSVVEELLPQILSKPNRFKRLKHLPLEKLQLTPALLQSLKALPSLADIWPDSFTNVDDISFVREFPQLRRIGIFEQGPPPDSLNASSDYSDESSEDEHEQQPQPPYTPGATAPKAIHVVETIESLSLERRAQIESVGVASDSWTDELLLRLLTALPGLTELELRSKAVTSLAAFSAIASLRSSLKVLRLQTPSVPRDDVTHLHSLLQLERLSIKGSFSEPLFAKQLFPFLPPYPKQPLHWLRSFVPRSAKEPVPTPPVDPAAKATADAEFAARVRSGQVSPAESLIPAQLSGALEFLDVREFSFAARSCRLWRMAAALPSAWTRSSQRGAGEISEIDARSSDEPLGSGLWSHAEYNLGAVIADIDSAWPGRVLFISFGQPQCHPAILPSLPIWRQVTALGVNTHNPCYDHHDIENCLSAIALLPRLETLSACFDGVDPKVVNSVLEKAGPHLRRLFVSGLPPNAYRNLSALVDLKVTAQDDMFGPDLACLHRLRRLSIHNCCITHELAEGIRALSRDHALRELDIGFGWTGADRADFFRTLSGQPTSQPAGASSDATEAMDSESKGMDQPAAVLERTSGLPALLTRLCVSWMLMNMEMGSFSMASVMHLPQLRHLELRIPGDCIELHDCAAFVGSGTCLPPIETLLISVEVFGSLNSLGLLGGLRDLRLRSMYDDESRIPSRYASVPLHWNPRWGQKLLTLKQLEVLALVSVRVDPTDLAQLDQLPNLRALSLNWQRELRVADLSVLPRIQSLRELELEEDPLLLLQRREWMQQAIGSGTVAQTQDDAVTTMRDVKAQGEEAVAAFFAVASAHASPSSNSAAEQKGSSALGTHDVEETSSQETPEFEGNDSDDYDESPDTPYDDDQDMLPLLMQCRSLRLLRWRPAYRQLQDSVRYTSSHSGLKRPSRKSRYASDLELHRERQELARERQALRTLISTNPELKIEYSAMLSDCPADSKRALLLLPPAAGSPAEIETQAAAEAVRKLTSDTLYEETLASNPLLMAYEDRALLAIEAEEEQEWRADAERKEAATKQKRKKQRRKY